MLTMEFWCLLLLVAAVIVPSSGQGEEWGPEHRAEIVKLHNEKRKEEKGCYMNAMKYDKDLESQAETWAKQCKWGHEGANNRGENIAKNFAKKNYSSLLQQSANSWWKEIHFYNYSSDECGNSCHYTQVTVVTIEGESRISKIVTNHVESGNGQMMGFVTIKKTRINKKTAMTIATAANTLTPIQTAIRTKTKMQNATTSQTVAKIMTLATTATRTARKTSKETLKQQRAAATPRVPSNLRPTKTQRMIASLRPTKVQRMIASLRPTKVQRMIASLKATARQTASKTPTKIMKVAPEMMMMVIRKITAKAIKYRTIMPPLKTRPAPVGTIMVSARPPVQQDQRLIVQTGTRTAHTGRVEATVRHIIHTCSNTVNCHADIVKFQHDSGQWRVIIIPSQLIISQDLSVHYYFTFSTRACCI